MVVWRSCRIGMKNENRVKAADLVLVSSAATDRWASAKRKEIEGEALLNNLILVQHEYDHFASLNKSTEIFVMDRALIRENVLIHLDSLHRSAGHFMIHPVFPLETKGVTPMF